MTDDLSRPLGQGTAPRRRRRRLFDPLAVLAGLIALGAVVVACWMMLVEDPFGGEPTAIAAIEAPPPAPPAPAAPPVPSMTPNEIAAATRIIDPETGLPVGGEAAPPARERVSTLSPAPDPRLIEDGQFGPIPRIAEDGARPADVYARPVVRVPGAGSRRVAIVVSGLGLSSAATEAAIAALPGAVGLSFVPYGDEVAGLAAAARRDGHETLLEIPMEPYDYPDSDPGPRALLTSLSAEENRERLHWVMAQAAGYAATLPYMGARFTSQNAALEPVLMELRDRGLAILDGGGPESRVVAVAEEIGLQAAQATPLASRGADEAEIDAGLAALEARAQADGQAVAIASPEPHAIARIARWAEGLAERGVLLVPASAIMPRPAS